MKLNNTNHLFNNNWKTLRQVGETKFIKSMYLWIFLVPLFVKLFEFIPEQETINLVLFKYTLVINPSLPFSWKAFYISALFLAAANLIIQFRCPKIIKDHLSFQSFLNEGKNKQQLFNYALDVDYDLNLHTHDLERINEDNIMDPLYEKININDPVHYFWDIFEEASYKYFKSRNTCTIFLTIGFLLFIWVTLQNIYIVFEFMLK